MRKIRYSAGVKGIILSLMEAFSIILVICMILVANLLDRNMLEFGDLKNKNFLESGSYEKLFRDETDKIFQYIEYKNKTLIYLIRGEEMKKNYIFQLKCIILTLVLLVLNAKLILANMKLSPLKRRKA